MRRPSGCLGLRPALFYWRPSLVAFVVHGAVGPTELLLRDSVPDFPGGFEIALDVVDDRSQLSVVAPVGLFDAVLETHVRRVVGRIDGADARGIAVVVPFVGK